MADPTRQRILEAAGPIFAEKGFEAATVRHICQAAGVNLASINYHFGDKQRLYLETVRLAHGLRMQRVPSPELPAELPAPQKLRRFIHAMLARMLQPQELDWSARLLIREMIQPTIACGPIVEDFVRPQFNQLLQIIDQLVPKSTPLHRRHQLAFSIVGQCLHYRVAGHFVTLLLDSRQRTEHFDLASLAQHITDFSLAALGGLASASDGPQSAWPPSDVPPPKGPSETSDTARQ